MNSVMMTSQFDTDEEEPLRKRIIRLKQGRDGITLI